jgi:tRNA 2-thiocytidine biosynthesis protein TtcA
VAKLIDELAKENPKVPSNILHALQSVRPSQLMDSTLWNFKNLHSEKVIKEEII